jgi:hypothetical protein
MVQIFHHFRLSYIELQLSIIDAKSSLENYKMHQLFIHFSLSPCLPPPPPPQKKTPTQNYLMKTKHPLVPVSCIKQGQETPGFEKILS